MALIVVSLLCKIFVNFEIDCRLPFCMHLNIFVITWIKCEYENKICITLTSIFLHTKRKPLLLSSVRRIYIDFQARESSTHGMYFWNFQTNCILNCIELSNSVLIILFSLFSTMQCRYIMSSFTSPLSFVSEVAFFWLVIIFIDLYVTWLTWPFGHTWIPRDRLA